MDHSHPLGFAHDVNVVQECKQSLFKMQTALHCVECVMLTQREEQRHQCISLFAALSLLNLVHSPKIVLPPIN